MAREYVPLPIEYLEEMAPLTDEDFGRLVRALLLYAKDGTPVDLEGDCRFYCTRVMNKDKHYAERAAEEEEKALKRSRHAKWAADSRYTAPAGESCPGMPGQVIPYQTKPIQTKPIQTNPNQTKRMLSARSRKSFPLPRRRSRWLTERISGLRKRNWRNGKRLFPP